MMLVAPKAFAISNWLGDLESSMIVTIDDNYIDVHSGPGRGFPKVYVIEKGESILLIEAKTDWVKIKTHPDKEAGRVGWIRRDFLAGAKITLADSESTLTWADENFLNQRFELGYFAGDFSDEPLVAVRGAWRINNFFSWETSLSQITSDVDSLFLYHTNIVSHPLYRLRFSPYFTLGAGYFRQEPKETIIDVETEEGSTVNVGIGLRAYITRRFMVRAEFRNHILFLADDNHDSQQEYSLGFSFFFGETIQPKDPEFVVPTLPDNDFEFGLFTGIYHLDDFGSQPTVGIHLSYHATEDFFVEASYAESSANDENFRSEGLPLFTDEGGETEIVYYDFAVGYKMLPGEVVISAQEAWPHYFYVIAGVGSTEIVDDHNHTTFYGAGYRIYPDDKLSLQFGFRQHSFDLNILGAKRVENTSFEIGAAISF
ncbi:MAG: outer membrane beta-barrel domain-containing protein [Pseudomonadota bacterium]